MSVRIMTKKPAGKTSSFTFGSCIEFDAETVKKLKLESAFKRIADYIIKHCKKGVGVDFTQMNFGIVLDTTEKPNKKVL